MTKKKGRQRRQLQKRQKRAAKHAERRKRLTVVEPSTFNPVLFDQDEAAAIASMMAGGSSRFADRFGSVLLDTDQLLEEAELTGLALDAEQYLRVVSPLMAEYDPALTAADEDDFGAKDELWLEIRGRIAAQLVQTGFRDDLLGRLNDFIGRARGDASLEGKWRSAVALKFLLEQPPAGDASRVWSGCQLILVLITEVEQEIAQSLAFQATIAAATGREEWLSSGELLDALDNPDVFEKLSNWIDEHPSPERDLALDSIQDETLTALMDGEWLPALFSIDQVAVFARFVFDTIHRQNIDPRDPAFPLLEMTRRVLAEILSPQWLEALGQRIRHQQRTAAEQSEEELGRWLALELMLSGFEDEPVRCPALIAALISQYNESLDDEAARASLRSVMEQRYPDMPAAQLDELLE